MRNGVRAEAPVDAVHRGGEGVAFALKPLPRF
jgi:hypothetical protein